MAKTLSDAYVGYMKLATNHKSISNAYRSMRIWIIRRVPIGLRSLIGLLLIIGGIFGFLPILGFWMIPLGVAVILIDWAQMRRSRERRRNYAKRLQT